VLIWCERWWHVRSEAKAPNELRELGVDRKTVKRWLRLGAWQPRRHRPRPWPIDGFVKFIEQRGPEVGWNGVVLYRELAEAVFRSTAELITVFAPLW
jgi:hypothetical protein